MTTFPRIEFAKGHGTGNDFVLLPDDMGQLELTSHRVKQLCDRHRGIGADGVLRVVRTAQAEDAQIAALAKQAEWFMDYRNADGSTAEMCGNGIRVFAHYLRTTGRVTENEVPVATRAGIKLVRVDPAGYAVSMGRAEGLDGFVKVHVNRHSWSAAAVAMPNPHAVSFVDSFAHVGDLLHRPLTEPADFFPDGANFEFVEAVTDRRVRMRVYERGVGETQSCGTGACAVAWAMRRIKGVRADVDTEFQVDVPGGTVWVQEFASGEMVLRGPAEIVATGTISESLWR